ncbi:MAG: hypothetical protein CVU20_10745 [Betaproteobacteria bacterium HGW-Betaproteobacteria-14]|nr:MAG: hypothetical protein CVU20_10745 [Betaproteobacteria bacterium HGW-Betaproteobacteria-14]
MPLDMTQFHQVFFDETAEHLATMESLLLHLDAAHPDPAQLDDFSRAAHSIKGSGGTFGFHDLADLAQEVEALIALARKGSGRLSAETVASLREACGVLRALLAGYRGDEVLERESATRAIAKLRGHAADRQGAAKQSTPALSVKVSPHGTAKNFSEAAGELQELARRTATASNEVMALVEAAGSGGLQEVTEAVRGLGAAIEQNVALVERAAENADSLRESFLALVKTIAGLALSSPGSRAASGRFARQRPLPKVRGAAGGEENGRAWPEY